MRQIVLDTETTGLTIEEGHRIIEIGCVELINRKLTGKRFHHYVNPQREIDSEALAVHGITRDFLFNKPTFSDIVDQLIAFISGAELIIHNAAFDIGFLNYELTLISAQLKTIQHYCQVIDSLVIARQLHIGQRNSLDALCKRYSIDNAHREYHGALLDAHLLAQVYLAMTGGQSSLFDDVNQVDIANIDKNKMQPTNFLNFLNLTVIKATEEELLDHDNYLKKMHQKGRCHWLDLVTEN